MDGFSDIETPRAQAEAVALKTFASYSPTIYQTIQPDKTSQRAGSQLAPPTPLPEQWQIRTMVLASPSLEWHFEIGTCIIRGQEGLMKPRRSGAASALSL